MPRFIIQGGNTLSGRCRVPGNKNAALPMLAAALLTDEPVTLTNLPLIDDVQSMLALLDGIGVDIRPDPHRQQVTLQARGNLDGDLDRILCGKVRSSILFAGPLCARLGHATIPPPGGDVIGRRRLDSHLIGLRKLGVDAEFSGNGFEFRVKNRLQGTDVTLDEASVTATENLIMAAVLAKGRTELFNAACEPHVRDLCRMLIRMGAGIEGVGSNRLIIEGCEKLHGTTFRIGPDFIVAGSLMAATAATGGDLTVDDIVPSDMEVIRQPFERLGVFWNIHGSSLFLHPPKSLRVRNDFDDAIPKVEDGTWPNFPSDLLSAMIVLATQAEGTLLFFEKMFESRLYFVDNLIRMGARIIQCDPHRVVVSGPMTLHGTRVASPDIRAGMALLIAALCAHGETIIQNAETIDRGYAQIDRTLRSLGAVMERQDD